MFWKRWRGRSAPRMARSRSRGRKRGPKALLQRTARVLRWTFRILLLLLILDLTYLGLTWPDWNKLATGPVPKSAFMREYEKRQAHDPDLPPPGRQPGGPAPDPPPKH